MIPIVFSTDHNYVMPTGIAICSLLQSATDELYDIYIMTGADITDEDRTALKEQVSVLSPGSAISFVEMDKYFKSAYEIRGISKAAYYRLMIPWLIPHIDKLIYADVDIIFKSSLKELYEIDLEGNYLGAALTSPPESWEKYRSYFKKIGLEYDKYFNSGVLVINSRLQREVGLNKEYMNLESKKFLYQDQDILNIVCKDKVVFFDKRYNLLPDLYDSDPLYIDNVVIHYAGDKPWKSFTYAWAEWWNCYHASIFHNPGFYVEVARRLQNPVFQFNSLIRKGKIHAEIMKRKLF